MRADTLTEAPTNLALGYPALGYIKSLGVVWNPALVYPVLGYIKGLDTALMRWACVESGARLS
jgi:hypothetical protein